MQFIFGTAEQPSGDVVKRVPTEKASDRKRADATQSRDDVPSYIQRNRTDDSRSDESNVTEPTYAWSRAGSTMTAASTVMGTYNWDDVFEQIKFNPSAARTDDGGVLPLHAACGAGAPLSFIKMLLDVYPEGARVKCDDGYLPIFYYLSLVTESPSEDIVSALIEAYPESAAVADSDKRLPIHYACKATGVSEGIFTTLLRAYPKAAYVCDADGMYPVDYAAANKDTATRKMALAALIDNDPEEIRGQLPKEEEAVTEPDEDANPTKNAELEMLVKYFVDEKSLLIHLKQCVTNGSVPSEVIMSALMDCYPESAAVAEEDKQLPLHLACQAKGIQKKFFKMILHAYPQGAYACDAGGKYPIDYAIANKDTATKNMALALLSANDEGKFRGRNDNLQSVKEGEEVTFDDVKSQFSQSTMSLGSKKSAQLLQAMLSNSNTKSQIVAIARSRSAMSKSAQNFEARRSTESQISNSSPKSVQDFVPAVRSLSTSATSLMSIMTSKSPQNPGAPVARSRSTTSTASQVSKTSSKSAQDMKFPEAMSRDTTGGVDLDKILADADLLLKDTRAALDQSSGSAPIHSDGEHVSDSTSSPTAGDVMVQVARSESPVSTNSSKSKISWKSFKSGTSKKSSKSRVSKSETSAAELEMSVAVARPDSPVITTSAKSKISWKSSKSGSPKKSSKSSKSETSVEKDQDFIEPAVARPDSPVSTTSAKSKTSSKSETSKKSSSTEAEAAALLQATATDENLAEVINFLQLEYDVALTEEEDEGDVTETKPKSSWPNFKGLFKTTKSKKMKK